MKKTLGWGWTPGDRYTEKDVIFHRSDDGSLHRLTSGTDLKILREAEAKAEEIKASGDFSVEQQDAFLAFVRDLIARHAVFKSRRAVV